ncbi:type IV secretion system protein VirB6 [Burkholderia sp. WP9]|uniref:type IV secretion system protein n=1 Tax=Burkholderia sp. WP9 TaxID=1500263 RepID=UPI0008962F50|nr:type IV secretion system protein [Burkholderia sp. WP9]SEF11265.1 type IV secretion system protein VirB6 [Burkholderia sp. WP9]
MAYDGVTQIFTYMDAVTTQIVAANVSRIIGWAAPLAALGLVIMLTVDGLAIMLRPTGEPLSQLVEKFIKYFAIVAIAGAGGLYATTLASTAMHLPDELGSVLLLNGSTASGSSSAIASMIDSAMDHSLTVMRTLFDQAGITSERGLVALVLGIVVIISTLLICGIGAISILLAKFLLAITVCFGPFFILLLIVPPLVSFFGNWLGSVLNYILLIAMTAMSFGIFMHFFDNAISAAANPNPNSGALMAIITAGIITVMAVVLLKSLPDLAARWTNGVSTKLAQHIRQAPSPAGNGGGKGGGGGSVGRTESGSGSSSGSSGPSSGGSGAYSYARGSQGSGSYGGSSSSWGGSGSSSSSSSEGSASNVSARGSQGSQSNS